MYGHLLPLVPEGENYSYFTSDKGYKKSQYLNGEQSFQIFYINVIVMNPAELFRLNQENILVHFTGKIENECRRIKKIANISK